MIMKSWKYKHYDFVFLLDNMCVCVLWQTYSKDAVDHVKEALTQAQKTRLLPPDIFEVSWDSDSFPSFIM